MSEVEKVEIGMGTLYCGDCLAVTEIIKDQIDHTITDPPYEASMHTKDRLHLTRGAHGQVDVHLDAHTFGAMDDVTRARIIELIQEKTQGWGLIFCQSEGAHFWIEQLKRVDSKYRFTGIWVKPTYKPNISGYGPGLGYESIVGTWCGTGQSRWNGGGKAAVWTANPEMRTLNNKHTSIKPQKLMTQLVADFTNKDELIFDPFMGSGSTGVAAIGMGRRFIGIERDPEFFEICCRRIEEVQKGMFHAPYTKNKGKVTMPLFEGVKANKYTLDAQSAAAAPKAKPVSGRKRAERAAAAQAQPAAGRFAMPTVVLAAGVEAQAAPREIAVTRTSVDAKVAPAPVSFTVVESQPVVTKRPLISPLAEYEQLLDEAGDDRIVYDDQFDGPKSYVGLDIEVFYNFFLVCFTRFVDNKKKTFELSARSELDIDAIKEVLANNCIVTFNGKHYDLPLLMLAFKGEGTHVLKLANNKIIHGDLRGWDVASGRSMVEKELDVYIDRTIDHIDLREPNPAVKQSLKTIYGRLHGRSMIDLPFNPEQALTPREMNITTLYCFNDLEATKTLFKALREPLELRTALGKRYGIDLRSASDAQVGERIIKKRVDILKKERVQPELGRTYGSVLKAGDTFKFKAPAFLKFQNKELAELLELLQRTPFLIGQHNKVVTPDILLKRRVRIRDTVYSLGIGGLHSTEETRAIKYDEDYELEDVDVSSQYPYILLALGLWPKALGRDFLTAYRGMVEERVAAKKAGRKTEADGGKIAVNGISGKLSSEFSVLYAPNMTAAMTLTGQFSSLMLIDRADYMGIETVSANTDGVLFRYRKDKRAALDAVIKQWEADTGFEIERTPYKEIYNSSVNTYMAIKPDGKAKRKGPIANPWYDGDLRGQMMKNPQMEICSDAVLKLITDGTPVKDTILAAKDPRDFVTVVKVTGGGTWRNQYIGRVVRFYWSTDCDPITATSASKTGIRTVANTKYSRPLMVLPDTLPDDVAYDRYIDAALEIAYDIGALERPVKEDMLTKRRSA